MQLSRYVRNEFSLHVHCLSLEDASVASAHNSIRNRVPPQLKREYYVGRAIVYLFALYLLPQLYVTGNTILTFIRPNSVLAALDIVLTHFHLCHALALEQYLSPKQDGLCIRYELPRLRLNQS